MARYLDENGLALLINNYLKPEDEYSLSSEHPVQNKVLTQTFGNLLSIIDYSKVTGYFHYANAAALPTVNSTGQEEGDFEYNPEKQLKIGQRAILDDTQAVMEISAIDSETGAITWTDTGLSFGGQVIQVDELPTASAAEEDKIYQYVGDTDALTGVTNGYFYKCVSDGALSPSYSWENIKVSEGDTIQVETLPTAGASEVGNIYQYVGETNLSFTNGYFYECVEDSGSYNWVEKEVQKSEDVPHWSGTRAEYEAQKDSIEDGTYVSILDDIDTHELVDVIEEDNMNPVTSNAVAGLLGKVNTISVTMRPDAVPSAARTMSTNMFIPTSADGKRGLLIGRAATEAFIAPTSRMNFDISSPAIALWHNWVISSAYEYSNADARLCYVDTNVPGFYMDGLTTTGNTLKAVQFIADVTLA